MVKGLADGSSLKHVDADRRPSSRRSSRHSRSRSSRRRDRSRSKERRSSRHRSSRDRRSRSRSRERSERRSSRRSRSRSSSHVVRRRKKSNFDVRPPGVTEENAAAFAAQAILQQNMAALSGSVDSASFGVPPQTASIPIRVRTLFFCSILFSFDCVCCLGCVCGAHIRRPSTQHGEIRRLTRCRCVFRYPLSIRRRARLLGCFRGSFARP